MPHTDCENAYPIPQQVAAPLSCPDGQTGTALEHALNLRNLI